MGNTNNIIACLQQNAKDKPNDIAYEFLTDLSLTTQSITYRQLMVDVTQIAKNLLENVSPGESVLLLYPPSIEYIKAFFACLMAGVVAIPLYPPKKNNKSDKVFVVAKASKAKFALTTQKDLHSISLFWKDNSESKISFLSTEELIDTSSNRVLPPISLEAPAFLQYTSGSTGNPKGVIITQGNILANTQYLERLSGAHEKDIFVNWLPLFHDLGLVTAILLPAYLGCKSVLMAPATFVRNPVIWLKAMTQFKGTIGGAPNFAYDLCTDKIAEEELANIDLSNWRIAYNAAEPVRYETLSRFTERFSSSGFTLNSFYPSYGMAESTAFISGGNGNDDLQVLYIDKSELADNKLSIVDEGSPNSVVFVGNGSTDELHSLKIVNPTTKNVLPDGEIGEVWFSGPSVSPGYWLQNEVSKQTFDNRLTSDEDTIYLQTGDLGFIYDGHVFITGRSKDLIILKGKNYYPQDLEATVKYCDDSIHPGFTAAFEENDKLIIVTEVNRHAMKTLNSEQLVQNIARSIYNQHNISVDDVVLLRPYQIPMTSSGKIRRKQTKMLYAKNALASLYNKISREEMIKPIGDVESSIHEIWCEILEIPEISVSTGFFELGGNSIKAIQIAAAVAERYSALKLDENKILECVSIKEMAELITLSLMKNAQGDNMAGAIRI